MFFDFSDRFGIFGDFFRLGLESTKSEYNYIYKLGIIFNTEDKAMVSISTNNCSLNSCVAQCMRRRTTAYSNCLQFVVNNWTFG